MKKIMIFAAAAALLSLSSCGKEEIKNVTDASSNGSPVFTAGINPGTKTTVNAQYGTLAWETSDVITITDGGEKTAIYYISGIDGSTGKATFEYSSGDELGAGPYSAVYGEQPEEAQTYSATAPGKLPMSASSQDNVLTFTVQCALMEINLTKEGESVKKIEVTGKPEGKNETTYTLTCTEAVSIAEQKSFYIALPAGTYTKIVITDSKDKVCTLNVKAQGIPVTVNQIIPATFGADNLNFKIDVDYVVMNMGTGQTAYKRKWATMNLGATTINDYGDLYSWGEIETKSDYDSGEYTADAKAISTNIASNSGKDVARVKLGGNWRMPTKDEFIDLDKACGGSGDNNQTMTYFSSWCIEDGKVKKGRYWLANQEDLKNIESLKGITAAGMLYSDGENYLFFPAAGFSYSTSRATGGSTGYYWSSTWRSADNAHFLQFTYSFVHPQNATERRLGVAVRPISD